MKILHISKYYYPYVGGVENICKYIVDASDVSGYKSAVVCFSEKSKNSIDDVNGVKVYRVGSWVTINRQALSLSYFTILYKAIKEFKPDVIQFHWANPFPAAVLLTMIPKDVKLVVHWHMDIIKQAKIYPLIKPIETRLLKRANLIVVTSPQYRDGSKPLQPFRSKIRIVQNAFDKDMFDRILQEDHSEEIKSRYGNRKIVFFVGRHIQYKGLPYLLEAEKFVKSNCVFVVAGGGPLTDQLKFGCHSDRIKFVGRLSDEELVWHHQAATIFAFPSITKNEAFGVALAEAMYCYTPAVTFTIEGSGVNWVNLNGVTGIEVPNGDAKAFAEALDLLLTDDVLAHQYAEAAHQRVVNNFTIPVMMEKMEECYNELNTH